MYLGVYLILSGYVIQIFWHYEKNNYLEEIIKFFVLSLKCRIGVKTAILRHEIKLKNLDFRGYPLIVGIYSQWLNDNI